MNHPILILLISIVFICSSFTPVSLCEPIIYNPNQHHITHDYINQSVQITSQSIRIIDIQDGKTLSLTIENNAHYDLSNIEISFTITDGIILSYQQHIIIPFLSHEEPGNTYTISNKIFGFGIGLLSPYPTITVLADVGGSTIAIATLETRILGGFITIISSVLNEDNLYDGYTLYAPEYSKKTYLLNNEKVIIHSWECDNIQGMATYLLENGNLLRTDMSFVNPDFPLSYLGGQTGHAGIYAPSGETLWDFTYSTDDYILHHDVEPLPNGNILMLAWECKTRDEAINAGRNPEITSSNFFIDYIIEVSPNGTTGADIIWEWHAWDHLIQDYDSTKQNYGNVKNHPELIDINYRDNLDQLADSTHINSIDYHEAYDQILLSVRNYNELWVIDHSTTTGEAAGHRGGRYGKGGDLLYRWGNPQTYRSGGIENQQLFHQHDGTWIPEGYPGEGNILVFNNQNQLNNNFYSTVDEIIPPVNENGVYYKFGSSFGPNEPIWQFSTANPLDFYSRHLSSAQRLPNGNTIICEGAKGRFIEINPTSDIIWSYTNTRGLPNHVFMIHRYASTYPGIQLLLDR